MSDKQRTTIVLTDKDHQNIAIIQRETGEPTIAGVIRMALRILARDIAEYIPQEQEGDHPC